MATSADNIRSQRSLKVIGLTGGVFQNVLLTSLASDRLRASGFEVLTHGIVPPNDGGLALGQVMVAAHRQACHAESLDQTSRERLPCV